MPGTALPRDQNRCLGARDLLGPAQRGQHRRVARDQDVALATGCLKDGGDQVGIRRQGQELAGALADRANGSLGVGVRSAGDNRDGDTFGRKRADERADIVADFAQNEVDTRVDAEPRQTGIDRVCLFELRTACDGNPGRLRQLTREVPR